MSFLSFRRLLFKAFLFQHSPNLFVFSVSKDGAAKKGSSHLCKMREYYWSNQALHFAPIGKVR
jgi:hypothetical protein